MSTPPARAAHHEEEIALFQRMAAIPGGTLNVSGVRAVGALLLLRLAGLRGR